ncbi:MAG: TIM barrel protein [Candidatus Solibacter usitatus]|nr:TIM barrel protein [Candidatus Solibacter usitatus]
MMRRRDFVAALPLARAVAAPPAYEPVLAAQAYIFSQVYPMHNLRMEDRIPEVFETLKSAGYSTVELVSGFFTADNASNTAQSLLLARMKCVAVYNGGVMHTAEGGRETVQQTLALAKRVKAVHPIAAISFNPNPKPKQEAKTDSELGVQAENLNKLAKDLKKMGLRLYIHQHAPEMAQEAREWRHILKNTDPKTVEFCLDTHWVLRGGQDPMTLLKECGTRLASIHLRNSKGGVWMEDFGDGDLDYVAVAAYLKQIAYRGYLVVELAYDKKTEMTRTLEENLRRSREYTERVFGVKA